MAADRYPIIVIEDDITGSIEWEVRTRPRELDLVDELQGPPPVAVPTPKGEELVELDWLLEETRVMPRPQLQLLRWKSTPRRLRQTLRELPAQGRLPGKGKLVLDVEDGIDWEDVEERKP